MRYQYKNYSKAAQSSILLARQLAIIAIITSLFAFDATAEGSAPHQSRIEFPDAECVMLLNNLASTKDDLCDSSDFSAFWTKGTARYLVQRRSGDTAEDNIVWIVDRKSGLFSRLNFGRRFSKSALEENPNMTIPDKFAARSLCRQIDAPKLRASDFVLLDKNPTNDDEKPYCYEPTYLTVERGKLVISINRRLTKRSDSDHVAHEVPARDRVRLIHLLDAVRNCGATVR